VFSLGGNLPGLSSNQAGVPRGSTGTGLSPSDFLATQGAANLNRESLRSYLSIVPQSERWSTLVNAELDLTGSAALFGELLWVDRTETRQLQPATMTAAGGISNSTPCSAAIQRNCTSAGTPSNVSGIFVPASNPFNPFGVPVRVAYLFDGVGPREDVVSEQFARFVTGIKGDAGRWAYEASVTGMLDESDQYTTNEVDPFKVQED
jgi:iron complex outermembrane recepter protein